MQLISLCVEERDKRWLATLAAKAKISRSALIRQLIREAFARQSGGTHVEA